jgi:hypothetical protein
MSLDKNYPVFSQHCRNGMLRQDGSNVAYSVEAGFAAEAYLVCTVNRSASLLICGV